MRAVKRVLTVVIVLVGASLVAGLAAQSGRPMTINDLLTAVRVDKKWTDELAKKFDAVCAKFVAEFVA